MSRTAYRIGGPIVIESRLQKQGQFFREIVHARNIGAAKA